MAEQQAGLFRAEVLEARKMRLEGEVLLSRPLRAHAIIGLLTCSMIALATWIATGRYARTEVAKGQLVTNAETAKIIALHNQLFAGSLAENISFSLPRSTWKARQNLPDWRLSTTISS